MATNELEYDRKQGFTAGEIKKIECVCGRCPVSGQWDEALVELVKAWQKEKGIEPDGKVWRSPRSNTWPKILAAFENQAEVADITAAKLSVGVWIDDEPNTATTQQYVRKLKDLGISEAALMINKSNTHSDRPPWELRWEKEKIYDIAKLLESEQIDVVLTVWPRPDLRQIDAMCHDLKELYEKTRAASVEVDVEGNWTDRFLYGFHSIDQASLYLNEKIREIAPSARFGLTTYPMHAEFKSAPSLSRLVDVLIPQAYSRYHGGDEKYGWNETYGPWGMQKLALTRAESVANDNPQMPQVVCGLAAWDQDFEEYLPAEAMQRAVDAALSLRVDRIRYWSSKWIVGDKKNDYSAQFIREIPKKEPSPVVTGTSTDDTRDIPFDKDIFDLITLQKEPPPKCKAIDGSVVIRDPEEVIGIVIHQTACEFAVSQRQIDAANGDRNEALRRRALNVACHALAFREGWVVFPHDLLWYVNHANKFNAKTLGLEIEGHYPGLISTPNRTTWGGNPTPVTDIIVETARKALYQLVEKGSALGMTIQYIYAHRQSNPNRTSDPGEELWRRVVLEYAVPVLHLKTDVEKVLRTSDGPGKPVPKEWDPNGIGRY